MLAEVLIVSLLISLDLTNAGQSNLSLKALCNGEKVQLRTIGQLNDLVEQIDSTGAECSDTIKTALRQLKELIEAGKRDVCTMQQASAVTNFVDNHLRDAADGTKRNLPKPLEKFIIAYGMKVSGICSHRMMREIPLMKWSKHIDEFLQQVSNNSPLSVLDPLIKPGEVILPVDLMQALPGLNNQIHLMIPKDMRLSKLKYICERVFQPIYEPLMLPLAHLIRAGFNNREYYWAWKYHYRSRFWSRAVFLCEIAKKIKFDLEQRAAIMKDGQAGIETRVDGLGQGNKHIEEEYFSTLEVKAKPQSTGDKILGRFDYSMNSLVKAFDANKDHVQRLRERIMKRGMRILRQMFKRKGLGKELKETLKAMQVRKGSISDLEEAKRLLLTLMESPEVESAEHFWLVKAPKFIVDLLLALVVIAIFFIPLVIFRENPFDHKVYDITDNYLSFSDMNLQYQS